MSDLMSITPRQPPGGSGGVRVLPDLHPFPAGAHVLAQEEAVERDGPDEEEELLHCLPHELGVQAVLAHGAVEVAQLLQDGGHRVGVRVVDAGRPLAEARGLQAGNALQTLVLQHARHCRGDTQRTFSLLYVPVSGGATFSTRVSSGCSCDKAIESRPGEHRLQGGWDRRCFQRGSSPWLGLQTSSFRIAGMEAG